MKSITKVLLAVSLCVFFGMELCAAEPILVNVQVVNNADVAITINNELTFTKIITVDPTTSDSFTIEVGGGSTVTLSFTKSGGQILGQQVELIHGPDLSQNYSLTFTDEIDFTGVTFEPSVETFSSLEEAAQNFQEIIKGYLQTAWQGQVSEEVMDEDAYLLSQQYLVMLQNNSIDTLEEFLRNIIATILKNSSSAVREPSAELMTSLGLVKTYTAIFQHLRTLNGGEQFAQEIINEGKRLHGLSDDVLDSQLIEFQAESMHGDQNKMQLIEEYSVNFFKSLQVLDPSFDLNAVVAEVVDEYVETSALAAQVQGAEQPLATLWQLVNQEYVQKKNDNDFVLLMAENLAPIVFTIKQVFSDFISQFSSFFAHKAVQTTLDLQNLEYQLGLDVLYEQLEQDMQTSDEKVAIISQVKNVVRQGLQEYELIKKELQEADAHLLFHLHTLKLELPQTVDDFNFDPALQQGDAEYEAVDTFLLSLQEQIDTLFSTFS